MFALPDGHTAAPRSCRRLITVAVAGGIMSTEPVRGTVIMPGKAGRSEFVVIMSRIVVIAVVMIPVLYVTVVAAGMISLVTFPVVVVFVVVMGLVVIRLVIMMPEVVTEAVKTDRDIRRGGLSHGQRAR